MRGTFESVGWVEQMAHPKGVSLAQSGEGMNWWGKEKKKKKADLSPSKSEFLPPDGLWTEHQLVACLWTQTKTLALPGS